MNYKIIIILSIVLLVIVLLFLLNSSSNYEKIELHMRERHHHSINDGTIKDYNYNPKKIFAFGLTYLTHIKETSSEIGETPPIFMKNIRSLIVRPQSVEIPNDEQILSMIQSLDPQLKNKVKEKYPKIDKLMDYEVELGFVLLEDVQWEKINDENYETKIGYFISNDITTRFIQVLGEGQNNKMDYWGAAKSFKNFLPVGDKIWIPNKNIPNSLLNIEILCKVNNKVRQKSMTSDLIYSPKQMLHIIKKKYPDNLPGVGDLIITGTTGGVAFQVPHWKAKLSGILGLDRFTKLKFILKNAKNNKNFLQSGNEILFSGKGLGEINFKIISK